VNILAKTTSGRFVYGLIIVHGLANIAIGVSLLLWTNLNAETVLNKILPYWLWPCMFIGAGVCAFAGLKSRNTAQFAYAFAAIVTGVFGLASLFSVLNGSLNAVPTTVFLLYICILKLAMARFIEERDTAIQQRDHVIEQVVQATEIGQTALDDTADGTEPTR